MTRRAWDNRMPFATSSPVRLIPLAACAALHTACSHPAPPPPDITLRPADATLPVDFSFVGAVRELPDGRVIIADEQETRLVVADSALRGVTPISRTGDGPGEFRTLSIPWALGGDSTLIPERNRHRWIILDRDSPVATMAQNGPAEAPFYGGRVVGSDGAGEIIGLAAALRPNGRPVWPSDSSLLLRVRLNGARVDTLGQIYEGMKAQDAAGEPAAASRGAASTKPIYVVALIDPDQVAVFADGSIAIARTNPYRVDWCTPSGTCTSGRVLAPRVPMTDREKHAYLEFTAKTTRWPPTKNLDQTVGWTSYVPPFVMVSGMYHASPLVPLPDGRLLILRLPSADHPLGGYDVIDRHTGLVGHIALPINQRIVGAGMHSIYLVTTDDNDLQHLERRPWP